MRHPGIVSQSLDAFGGDFRRRAVRRYPVLARNKPTVTATATIASKASTVGRAATRYNSLVRINVPFNLAPSLAPGISQRMRTKNPVCNHLAESIGLLLL